MKYFLGLFLWASLSAIAANNVLSLRARVPATFNKQSLSPKADSSSQLQYKVIKDPKKGQVTVIYR